jgi:hypothetical protein
MSGSAHAAQKPVDTFQLSQSSQPPSPQSSQLRFRLENLFNEVDLLLRNHKADLSDIRRQEMEMKALQVYERIPLERDIPGLQKSVTQSAQESELTLSRFHVNGYTPIGGVVPRQLPSKDQVFRFTKDQLVETIDFQFQIQGSSDQIHSWISQWPSHILRWIELDSRTQTPSHQKAKFQKQENQRQGFQKTAITPLQKNRWKIQAVAYRYRQIQYPEIRPSNPRDMLPTWARQNPKLFSEQEPYLWSLVTQIETISPKTKSAYMDRGRFLLNDARMDFYLSKAVSSKASYKSNSSSLQERRPIELRQSPKPKEFLQKQIRKNEVQHLR